MKPSTLIQPLILKNCRTIVGKPPSLLQHKAAISLIDGRIASVSTSASSKTDNATQLDLNNAVVLPGLCDAHMHLAAGGQALSIPDLTLLDREGIHEALLNSTRKSDNQPNRWIEAFNWDEDACTLNADLLEEWLPGRIVVIHKRDLHGCCVSRTALNLVGTEFLMNDPEGGRIGRKTDGSPTGMLFESAVGLLLSKRPKVPKATKKSYILSAQSYLTKLGITAVGEVLDYGNAELYLELAEEGSLKLEVDGWQRYEHWDGAPPSIHDDRFHVNTLKIFLDGSFGSRTAALFEPFTDTGDNSGMLLYTDIELREVVERAVGAGWKLAIHAIGDQAAEQACRVLAASSKPAIGHHRIEHLQLLPVNGIECVSRSGAAASIQPVHLLDDQIWLPGRIGPERCLRSFIWKSLLDRGVPIAIGSDWPVAFPDPLLNIHTTINRAGFGRSANPIFNNNEALTPLDAISTASWGYAVITGSQDRRGAIHPGYEANLTIIEGLNEDLSDWSNARVLLTISKGEIIYDSSKN